MRIYLHEFAYSGKRLLNIQVNNGPVDSLPYSSGVAISTSPFAIGATGNAIDLLDGAVDEVGFWKRVLTAQERTALYNSGLGLTYPFTP
jgi:hypothetical protein